LYAKLHKSIYGLQTFVFFLLHSFLKKMTRIKERRYIKDEFVDLVTKHNKSVILDDLYGSKDLKTSLVNHLEYKLEHLLKWSDKNSMGFSIESRTPFLYYRLIEYTLSMPSNAVIKNGYTKYTLREAMKGILPEKIRLRKGKVGFATPANNWFRTEDFKKLVTNILDSDTFAGRNIIDAETAKSLYQKHLNKEINISKDIWKWIHLEMWFRKFID